MSFNCPNCNKELKRQGGYYVCPLFCGTYTEEELLRKKAEKEKERHERRAAYEAHRPLYNVQVRNNELFSDKVDEILHTVHGIADKQTEHGDLLKDLGQKMDAIKRWSESVTEELSAPGLDLDAFCDKLDEHFEKLLKEQLSELPGKEELRLWFGELANQLSAMAAAIPENDPEKDEKIRELEAQIQALTDKFNLDENDLVGMIKFYTKELKPAQYAPAYLILRQAIENFFRFICGCDLFTKLAFQKQPGEKPEQLSRWEKFSKLIKEIPPETFQSFANAVKNVSQENLPGILTKIYQTSSESAHDCPELPDTFRKDFRTIRDLRFLDPEKIKKDYLKLFKGTVEWIDRAVLDNRVSKEERAELKASLNTYKNDNVRWARNNLRRYLDAAEKAAKNTGDEAALEEIRKYRKDYAL